MQFLCTSLLQIIYFRCADGNERKQPNIIWQHNTAQTQPITLFPAPRLRVWYDECGDETSFIIRARRDREVARAPAKLYKMWTRRANNTFSIWHSHIHTIMRTQRQTCTHTNKIQQHHSHNSTQPTTAQWSQQFWTNIQKYIQRLSWVANKKKRTTTNKTSI